MLVPTLFLGNLSGHDFEFHLNSWMEVQRQWTLGIAYPRWAALAHYGYGEARFIFYPPVSWMLGALLGAVFSWAAASDLYIWLVLTLSGCSMFLLARHWLERRDAILAAVLYTANPYYLVIVYWRSAFAELLAGALLPLLLLWVSRADEEANRVVIPLGMIVAAAWLSNAPAAVMVNYSLALLVLVMAITRRSPRIILYGATAVVLAAGLAAFYLLPAAYEAKWVNIAEVLSPGVRPVDNFLFTITADADHNRFNFLVSLVAFAEIVTVAAAMWLARNWRRRNPSLWWSLIAWAGLATALLFRFSFLLWEHLPKLRFVQLPWRWLLCMNVAFALTVTTAWRRWLPRLVICAAMLGMILFVWYRLQPPWWDSAADIAEMHQNIWSGQGYDGADEYVPAGADPYEIDKDAPLVSFEAAGPARIQVERWNPESRTFTADVSGPGKLVLRLFNYPAWHAEVNGEMVATDSLPVTGQVVVPVRAGLNRVTITFVRTSDRTLGGIVSFIFFLGTIAAFLIQRRRSSFAASRAGQENL